MAGKTVSAAEMAERNSTVASTPARVTLFGGLSLEAAGHSVTRFRTQKTAALLAYISFHADRLHARDLLCEMFWGDSSGQNASLNLSVALSSLRGAFQSIGVEDDILRTERQRVGLDTRLILTDVGRFENLLDAADSLSDRDAASLLQNALALYRGPLLPGFYEDWVVGQQVRLADRFWLATRRLSQIYFQQGDVASGIACVRRVLQFDTTHVEAARTLIRVQLEAQQPGEAARVFHELHQALLAVGDEVSAQATLGDLYAVVEPHLNSYQRRAATGAGLRKRGRKPGRTDERLTCVAPSTGAGVELLFPTRALDASATIAEPTARGHSPSLPLPLTRFFGRDDEMLRLGWLLGDPSTRLVTLTGPGGIGKTRLALAVAQERHERRMRGSGAGPPPGDDSWNLDLSPFPELAEPEPDGLPASDSDVLFVTLTDTDTAARLPDILAEQLGIRLPERSDQESADLLPDCGWTLTALNMLSVALASRPGLLLILDNLDGLIETHVPDFLERLLTQCSRLTVLATSRRGVPITGAREFQTPPLPTLTLVAADERTPDGLLAQWPSLALFVDRARLARPGFQLSGHNLSDVVELVHRLEGLPLALELAAARCQVLTPHQILHRLENRLDLLVSARYGKPDRRQSLRESLLFSYRLLSPVLQGVFARLSVFRGGFTLDAAFAVTDDSLADDHLAQLADASLVQVHSPEYEGQVGTEVRFTQLETLREFAAEQFALLSLAEQQATTARHAVFYAEYMEQAKPHLSGPDAHHWLPRLTLELPNVQLALDNCMTQGGLDNSQRELALRFGAALTPFWHRRGMHGEGARMLRTILGLWKEEDGMLLPSCHDRTTCERLAQLWNGVGVLKMSRGEWDAAQVAYNRGLLLWQQIGDARGIAATRNNRAILEQQMGDLETAQAEYEASLAWWRQVGDEANVARLLNNLSILATWQGRHQVARVTLTESLAVARQSGDILGFAARLYNLGILAIECGKPETARPYFENSLKHGREGGNWALCARNVASLALLRMDEHAHCINAQQWLQVGLTYLQVIGQPVAPPIRKTLAEKNLSQWEYTPLPSSRGSLPRSIDAGFPEIGELNMEAVAPTARNEQNETLLGAAQRDLQSVTSRILHILATDYQGHRSTTL